MIAVMQDKNFEELSEKQLHQQARNLLYELDDFALQNDVNLQYELAIVKEDAQSYTMASGDIRDYYEL